jgi:hypothetical protein
VPKPGEVSSELTGRVTDKLTQGMNASRFRSFAPTSSVTGKVLVLRLRVHPSAPAPDGVRLQKVRAGRRTARDVI